MGFFLDISEQLEITLEQQYEYEQGTINSYGGFDK
jgi:hypothetical protein